METKNKSFELDDEIMEKINAFTRRRLSPDEVYAFPVILCDNEIDRDNERFSISALKELAKLFIGKTGIFDHNPKGENQTSRIFDAEVLTDESKITSAGEPYTYIEAKAYIMQSEKNSDLIAEIDGGIKKEVSVSCSVEQEICSVCQKNRREKMCAHVKGRTYGGKTCHVILNKPTDAYEWSFVAIPAQKNAGVRKGFEGAYEGELSDLKAEVEKLFYLCDTVLPRSSIRTLINKCGRDELYSLKGELESKLSKRAEPQLSANLKNSGRKGFSPYSLK